MMKKITVLLGGILSWGLSAQENQEQISNFVTYSDKITTSLTYFDSSNSYFLNYTENGQPQSITFRPNTQKQLIAGIDYKIITASIGFTPAFMKVNKEVQKSKQFNLRFQINYKKWFQTLSYAYHKGYFIDFNQMELYSPDLRTLKIGGVTSFVLNDHFSYKSLLSYNQWQKKSAGSFVANASYYYNNFKFNPSDNGTKVSVYALSLSPAYYYNFIIKQHFLISAGLVAGMGVNLSEGDISPIYEVSTHLRLAYNSENIFAFVGMNGTSFTETSSDGSFNDLYTTIRIGLGYRFNALKKMDDFYEETLQKIKK